jgi:hypothetical protein
MKKPVLKTCLPEKSVQKPVLNLPAGFSSPYL